MIDRPTDLYVRLQPSWPMRGHGWSTTPELTMELT